MPQQFVLATETKLPPNADYAALASTYFSPDAVVVVLPITALAGGLSVGYAAAGPYTLSCT
jgi:hypothetical protein